MQIIKKIKAVVEKLAGNIRIKTAKTGNQSSKNESLNEYILSLTFDKYRATYIIKTMKANVEV